MQKPIHVTFKGLPVIDGVEARCEAEAAKLERYANRVIGCTVVVAAPQHRSVHGSLFEVRVTLSIPGHELVVNRMPPDHISNERVDLAIREAFDTMRRRLEDAVQRQRGDVKHHEPRAVSSRSEDRRGRRDLRKGAEPAVPMRPRFAKAGVARALVQGRRAAPSIPVGERGP